MKLADHKIDTARWMPAVFIGECITPEIVILHDTAGRLEAGNSARYLASSNTAHASVHFVIERDGDLVQLVPTDRRANHAGTSSFEGRSGCNAFSIGIELVNPGRMSPLASHPDAGRAWWGETFVDAPERGIDVIRLATPEHGDGVWMFHTAAQMATLTLLLQTLFAEIPSLRDITTHWYVSPGRKFDPGPTFPLEALRARILGRSDPADDTAEAMSRESDPETDRVVVTARGGLNHRRWPSINPNVLAVIPCGELLEVERRGTFAGRDWLCVTYAGRSGWIVESHTDPAA